MTTQPVYVVDIMGQIVQSVSAQVLATIQANERSVMGRTSIQAINYQYGHFRELILTLSQMDLSTSLRFQKFPLVYLVMDFKEARGKTAAAYAEVSLQLLICHQTDGNYKVADRYVNVFKPVLYPIYLSLLQQITKHPMCWPSNSDVLPHDKWDRSYWGTSKPVGGGNTDRSVLNDFVDAIDIQNLQFKLDYQPCFQ